MDPIDLDSWAEALLPEAVAQISAAFLTLTHDLPASEVLGLGLRIDEQACALTPVVNTRSHHEEVTLGNPASSLYYLWSPDEWARDFAWAKSHNLPDDTFLLVEELYRKAEEVDRREQAGAKVLHWEDEQHSAYTIFAHYVWSMLTLGMKELYESDFFARWPEAVQMFYITDSSVNEDLGLDWVELYNSEAKAQQYQDYVSGES